MDGVIVERRVDSDAVQRLRTYFLGFGFDESVALERLIERALAALDPAERAEDVVAQIRRRVEVWFIDSLGLAMAASVDAEAIGRVAFLLSDAAQRWPQYFLDAEAPPVEMIDALRLAAPLPIPHPAVTMPEQNLSPVWSLGPVRQLLRRPASKAPQA
ncbi:hypothetical protein [Rhodospirillaceae bacterium SYSU D60014]|uniref:hypothetical protein n=1 Tax=Virgifigura deserti TaxID=2268457 RepID=UPI000E6640A5